MVPGQGGAYGGSVARHVGEVIGRENGSVLLLCMGGGLAVGRHMRVLGAGMRTAVVRQTFGTLS